MKESVIFGVSEASVMIYRYVQIMLLSEAEWMEVLIMQITRLHRIPCSGISLFANASYACHWDNYFNGIKKITEHSVGSWIHEECSVQSGVHCIFIQGCQTKTKPGGKALPQNLMVSLSASYFMCHIIRLVLLSINVSILFKKCVFDVILK